MAFFSKGGLRRNDISVLPLAALGTLAPIPPGSNRQALRVIVDMPVFAALPTIGSRMGPFTSLIGLGTAIRAGLHAFIAFSLEIHAVALLHTSRPGPGFAVTEAG